MTDDADFEAKAAAFSRANHHRWAIAYIVAGIACVVGGSAFTIGALMSEDSTIHPGSKWRLLVYALGAVAVGFVIIWRAFAIWRGKRDDV